MSRFSPNLVCRSSCRYNQLCQIFGDQFERFNLQGVKICLLHWLEMSPLML